MSTSYSDINTYQRCPKKYEYRVIRNLQPKKQNATLFRGIGAHALLRDAFLAMQAGDDPYMAMEEARDELLQEYRATMFDDELLNVSTEIDTLIMVLRRYLNQYEEEWEILHVEEQFEVTLDTGFPITFTPDLVVRDRNGSVWIVDHKTTTRTSAAGLQYGDMQALLYFSGVQAIYPEAKGFIFNRIRKKLPTQPRLAKTGKTRVANLAKIDTTFEVLRDFLKEKAPGLLNDPTHQRRLAELRDQERFFWTDTVYVTDKMVEETIRDVGFLVEQMMINEGMGIFPRHLLESGGYKDCRKCPFSQLCHAELVGLDLDVDALYEPRTEKNPYEEAEDDQD